MEGPVFGLADGQWLTEIETYQAVHFLVQQWSRIYRVWNWFCNFLRDLIQNYSQGHSKTFHIQADHTSYTVFNLSALIRWVRPIRTRLFSELEARMKTFLVIDVAIKMVSSEFNFHFPCITRNFYSNWFAMIAIFWVRNKLPAIIWTVFLTIWLNRRLRPMT